MSGAASKAKALKVGEANAEASQAIEAGLMPLIESDGSETLMAYDPNAHVPFVVIGVWICALVGLGAYFATYYVADLSKWVH